MNQSLITNIEETTKHNKYYRKVLNTTNTQQLVIMNLPYKEEIGMERHKQTTQFIKIEAGKGIVVLDNVEYEIEAGDVVIIAPNTWHNIISKSRNGLKLYTIYSPPEHKPGLKQPSKPINRQKLPKICEENQFYPPN